MNKLTQLHQYLASHFTLLGITRHQIQVHPEGGELQPGSGQVDIERGHHVAGLRGGPGREDDRSLQGGATRGGGCPPSVGHRYVKL